MRVPFAFLSFVSLVAFSGCTERELPTATFEKTEMGSGFTVVIQEAGTSGLVTAQTKGGEFPHEILKKIVSAEKANLLSTGMNRPGQATVFEDSYNIQYQEYVRSPASLVVNYNLVNTSNRAFSLDGIVIRYSTTAAGLAVSGTSTVSNKQKIAPGESINCSMTISNLAGMGSEAVIRASIMEVPSELSPAGDVTAKALIPITVVITKSTKNETVRRYYVRETRTHDGSGPKDLLPYLK
jgi:hypothetical protein